ncbi:MAG TPA: 6-bladed beta-propeller [Solirubrobacterales bacterium]|jgi:DNA-binding beta-propeller fold protein YncE|nr:6-bladed beta-propeller [Solirubrobacterales bacterium]
MVTAARVAVFGLLALAALAGPVASAAARPAHTSIGFEPIPLSVAADGVGHVYLSNPLSSHSVQQYSSDGELLAEVGSFAASGNPFAPRDITTDSAGALYVADSSRAVIYVLGADGGPLRQWSIGASGRDLAVAADGSVYLAGSHEIQRFSADGALLSKWGASGGADGQFGEIWGLDTSPSGLVYVADTYGNRIEVFTADGIFVTKWGKYGSGDGQFVYPYGIAVNAAGEVYVVDTANDRVQRFSAEGAFLGSWGRPGRAHGRFFTPTSVATDPAGYVYVADRAEPYPYESRARVQKFTADGQYVTQWYDHPPDASPGRPRLQTAVARRTAKRSASFRFRAPLQGATFICRLSGKRVAPKLRGWRSCSSPKRYVHLRPGRKVFHVRAVNGSASSREARYSWLIVAGG